MKNKIIISILLSLLLFSGCGTKQEKGDPDMIYVCSMDPQVSESKPGNCPICKMPLTPVKKSNLKNDGELHLSDQQIKLGHIKTAPAKEHTMHNDLHLTGTLTENMNHSSVISSWIMGRIEKLYFKSKGDKVLKGQPVYSIYSEELNISIKELKLAYEKKNNLNTNSDAIDRIINSTRKKLLLYGLTEKQINNYINSSAFSETVTIFSKESGIITSVDVNEGSYVMEGSAVFHLTDYSGLWAEAEIYTDDLPKVNIGMEAIISFPEMPGKSINTKISFVNPELNSSSKINLIRVDIPNKNNFLKPGMQADFSIILNTFSALAIPTNAIILDQNGAVVWIKTGHNKFKSVMVTTGTESNGLTEIKSGISVNDSVVISGAYLLNSEFIFRKGSNPMEGHDMGNM